MDTYFETNKLKFITDKVEGIGPWQWVEYDKYCWNVIRSEWEEYHHKNWFKRVKKFDVVLQAGGCCGLYPRLLAERFNKVYTFEPDPLAFHCLVNNCQSDSIIKLNAAIGNYRGLVNINRYKDNIGMTKISEEESSISMLPMMMIDDLNLPQLDLLALDLEGYEPKAIEGASKTISRLRPVIIVEQSKYIKNILNTFGYRFIKKSANDAIFIPEDK